MSVKLPALAFEICRDLGASIQGQKLLIACSGGLDSIVLVDVLSKLAPRLELELVIAHIHHGASSDEVVSLTRSRARDFVRDLAAAYKIPFYAREAPQGLALASEADLRRFRLEALEDIKLEQAGSRAFDRVALAHHADDLLETRLMRLIRGTGPQGLRAMREISEKSVRPFLRYRRQALRSYAEQNGLGWIEDPSNSDVRFFRNWLRREWIPLLEEKRPGASAALARSLDLLSGAVATQTPETRMPEKRFARREFHQLSQAEKCDRLARLTRVLGPRDFGQSKIIEVLKRLDRLEVTQQKHASFAVGGVEWRITPFEIEAKVPPSFM